MPNWAEQVTKRERRGLTIFGRSLLLLIAELSVNVICWVVCGILFRKKTSVLGLALLSWVRSQLPAYLQIFSS
jgi:hypothetical protein